MFEESDVGALEVDMEHLEHLLYTWSTCCTHGALTKHRALATYMEHILKESWTIMISDGTSRSYVEHQDID